ncbi:MAG: DNA alkylation repair protein [Candidatus Methanoplasma sp.]|jgi:3-methyladenine DNA glycosylase AlkD|nr:DNA alkylation repair protein [Candidatus Methanoplasma sp.]
MIDVRSEISKNADSKYREFHIGLVPGIGKCNGVPTPVLRKISREVRKSDWRRFLSIPPECYEETIVRALVIAGAKMDVSERLRLTEEFMPEVTNWAVCDIFCGEWTAKGEEEREALWRCCLRQMGTGDEFRMRVSAVMMLAHFIDGDHIDAVLDVLSSACHPGYYYKMGSAWAISVCFVKFPEKTEPVLFADALDKEIRDKAIQKICDSRRVDKADKERLKLRKRRLDRPL